MLFGYIDELLYDIIYPAYLSIEINQNTLIRFQIRKIDFIMHKLVLIFTCNEKVINDTWINLKFIEAYFT